jgi:hypothetical protein
VNGPQPDARAVTRRFRPRVVFLVFFALAFLSIACWSFASPLVAAPDEQAHVIRADALAHGHLGHPSARTDKVLVTVMVPESINEVKYWITCWQFHASVPASCSPRWTTSQRLVATTTHVGHYPPLYYALVGSGSYLSQQRSGIYAMRLVSAALSAAMLALSAYAVARWSRRRSIVAGVFAALTPITLFLSAAVNPSGFEIVTAISLWTAVAVMALEYPADPPRGLVAIIAVTASVLALIRGLSPLWVLLVALTLVLLLGPRRVLGLVRERRDVRLAAGAVSVVAILAVAWILTQGTLHVLPSHVVLDHDTTTLQTVRAVAAHGYQWLRESVGVLGWLDTPMPMGLYQAWYLLMLAVVLVGVMRANWRQRGVLVSVCALAFVVPVLVVSREARQIGVVWQGRDGMPLTVGALILGAALCARAARSGAFERWLATFIVATASILDVIAFYVNLRRYAIGVDGPAWFFLHNQGWSPPTGQLPTLVAYCALSVLVGALVIRWIWRASDPVDEAVTKPRAERYRHRAP